MHIKADKPKRDIFLEVSHSSLHSFIFANEISLRRHDELLGEIFSKKFKFPMGELEIIRDKFSEEVLEAIRRSLL